MMSDNVSHNHRHAARGPRARTMLTLAVIAATLTAAGAPSSQGEETGCGGNHFVASWTGSPTDAVTPVDAAGDPVPLGVADQTFRMIVTPHLGGPTLRLRLSNRYGLGPVTFGAVSVGNQVSAAAAADLTPVSFDGAATITVAAGAEVLSDPVPFTVAPFRPVAVSIHVTAPAGPPTKHWNANATSYYADAGTGDLTARPGPEGFTATTGSWFYVTALDVTAPAGTRSVVAFGDSITDGFVGSGAIPVPVDRTVADTDHRYPDVLQRRAATAGIPISVVNAGIGSNRVLTSGEPLMLGASGLARFDRDALEQSGVGAILVQEGINDLGLPPAADPAAMITGYQQLIAAAHSRGTKIWLGTLLPAADALINGVALAPRSETDRQQINTWIRGQRLADGVVDFDAALRDPADPSILRPDYSSPDRLHPSPAGYRAMAEAVDLQQLASALPPEC